MPVEVEKEWQKLTEEDFIHVEAPPLEILLSEPYKHSMYGVSATLDEPMATQMFFSQGPEPKKVAEDALAGMWIQRKQYASVRDFITEYLRILGKELKFPSPDMTMSGDFVPLVGHTLWELAVTGAMVDILSDPTWNRSVHASSAKREVDLSEETIQRIRESDNLSFRYGTHDILMAFAFGKDYFLGQGRPRALAGERYSWDMDKGPELHHQEGARRILFHTWLERPHVFRDPEVPPCIPDTYLAKLLKE